MSLSLAPARFRNLNLEVQRDERGGRSVFARDVRTPRPSGAQSTLAEVAQ